MQTKLLRHRSLHRQRLWQQDRRSGRGAALQVAMCFYRIAQRVLLIDRDLHRSLADDVEQIVGDRQQVLAFGCIGIERRTRGIKRPLVCKILMLKASTCPEALPKLTNMPSGLRQSSDAGKVVLPMPS